LEDEMKRTVLSISLAGLALLSCVALAVPANSQTNDSVQIQNIGPPPQTLLGVSQGSATRISVTVNYALSSADRASLFVFAEEYPESAGGCRGDVHQTNGGSQSLIQRGTGVATITVIWPGNGGANAKPVYPSGYVTVGANFLTPDGNTQIRSFGSFTRFCYHFVPGGAPGGTSGGVPGNRRSYPTIDRLTSLELLSNLEARAAGGNMEVMAHLNLPPIYPRGVKATEDFEGWVPYLYNDAARYCTIGYGHLIKKAPCNGTEPYQGGLTLAQGIKLLQDDLYSAHATVYRTVTIKLTDGQTAALTDFVFNVGSDNFHNSTLLKLVNASQFNAVPAQFRRWVMAGGKRLPGLVNRRQGEIDLFFDGMSRPTVTMRRLPSEPPENLAPIDIQAGEGH
jgi:GH24 family phage-related lysozyme (muramidase)